MPKSFSFRCGFTAHIKLRHEHDNLNKIMLIYLPTILCFYHISSLSSLVPSLQINHSRVESATLCGQHTGPPTTHIMHIWDRLVSWMSRAIVAITHSVKVILMLHEARGYWVRNCSVVCILADRFSAYWLRSKCFVCCQHIDPCWSWMRALYWDPFHCWAVQVLRNVTAQGGGRWPVTYTFTSQQYAKGCCTATTYRYLKNCFVT